MSKKDDDKKRNDPYTLRDIFAEMEMDLIRSFQRNFTKHGVDEINAGFSWEMWQIAMLRNINEYHNRNKEIIGEYRPAVKAAIKEVLNHSYQDGKERTEKQVEYAQIELDSGSFSFPQDNRNVGEVGKIAPQEKNFFKINEKKINALIQSTTDDFEDVTHAVYRRMDDIYRQVIHGAEIQMTTGASTLYQAVDKACEKFLAKGIDSIIYKNGAHVNIASYAEMALRTASHRATLLGEGTIRDKYNNHLVFVSAHANCCRLCEPWQGKILIDDVFSRPSDEYIKKYKVKYKLLSEAIKAGLLHPNCRHTLATWFEGISRLPEPVDKETALKNYDTEQKQRKLENAIRKAKRQCAGACDPENKAIAKKKLRQLQAQLRKHLKDNPEFKRDSWREKIHGVTHKIKSSLENFDESNLKDVDKDTILEVDKALTKIYDNYPHLKGIISEVKAIDQGTAYAEISIQNKGIKVTLGINKKLTPKNANAYTSKKYKTYELTKKPGIEGIIKHEIGHVLNYDYYMKKNKLAYNTPYGDAPLNKLLTDLKRNDFATDIRNEVFKRLGVSDTPENVERYFSQYANNESEIKNGDFFAEAFSDYSDTEAKAIFFEILKERMK